MRRKLDIASINAAPMRGNKMLENGGTVFMFQNSRELERYVEEFLDICHHATCDNICLMEEFRCGLDEALCFIMSRSDPSWTLESYINFALWTYGSTFTVGKAEDDNNFVQPHLTDVSQADPEHSPPTAYTTETTTPEPPVDGELPPATGTEPEMTAPTTALEPKVLSESDQECEVATVVPVGILVEIDSGEDWLIDWNTEILPPTLSHPDLYEISSLIIDST